MPPADAIEEVALNQGGLDVAVIEGVLGFAIALRSIIKDVARRVRNSR